MKLYHIFALFADGEASGGQPRVQRGGAGVPATGGDRHLRGKYPSRRGGREVGGENFMPRELEKLSFRKNKEKFP